MTGLGSARSGSPAGLSRKLLGCSGVVDGCDPTCASLVVALAAVEQRSSAGDCSRIPCPTANFVSHWRCLTTTARLLIFAASRQLLPIIPSNVNRDRCNWFATSTVLIGRSRRRHAAAQRPLTKVRQPPISSELKDNHVFRYSSTWGRSYNRADNRQLCRVKFSVFFILFHCNTIRGLSTRAVFGLPFVTVSRAAQFDTAKLCRDR
jgi:hypothetical protein